ARMVAVDYASHSAQVDRLEEEITAALAGISPRRGRVPMVSAMTGETLSGEELDAGYWFRSLRATVHFDRAVRALAGRGHQLFIEVTPHPVLMGAMNDTLQDLAQETGPGTEPAAVCGTLRRDEGGTQRLVTSLAEAFVGGAPVDWEAVLPGGRRVELPTYAFQHERFWPKAAGTVTGGDPAALGLSAMGHPLLGAAVELAGGAGTLCTGRLSVRTHPWLADHAVDGVVLLPGTGFVELVVRAGDQVGCGLLEELTLQTPLTLPDDGGAVQIQVVLAETGADGRRPVDVFSRPDAPDQPQVWTRHASGLLAPTGPAAATDDDFAVWPPRGATKVDVSGLYEAANEGPYGYGPAFQGLQAVWRRGEEVFAEVALPEGVAQDAPAFGLHPALLDAVLHASFLMGGAGEGTTGEVRLPFAWTGVELHASGASVLRARLRRDAAGTLAMTAADPAGRPVLSVASLITRPVDTDRLRSADMAVADALFTVAWTPIAGGEPVAGEWALLGTDRFGVAETLEQSGTPVRTFSGLADAAAAAEAAEYTPAVVLVCAGGADGADDPASAAARATGETLGLVQQWLAEDRLGDARLVVLTRGGVSVSAGEGVADLPAAALAGLVRSTQSENPEDRLLLVDLPATRTAGQIAALPAAVAAGEPEVAVRDGVLYGRRLTRSSGALVVPEGVWRLEPDAGGSLEGLALVPVPGVDGPLSAGQVRVAVGAAGLNFRDVLIALGMYPGGGVLGSEIAGTVLEAGPGVTQLAPGERVMGVAQGGFGPVLVTDARQLVRVPDAWTFADAASVPTAFMTAWYALVELAGVKSGQRVLVHAGAGGVGMAAVRIARYLGLEVFATASPGKWSVLAGMGLDEAHVSSSRGVGFEAEFLAATGGAGMDVVVNSLAGEFTDASLRLLPRGGAFVEMGRTDVRDAEVVAGEHPGVHYRPFDLGEAGPERLGTMLGRIVELVVAGELERLPLRAWDVRRARDAFRFMQQARHTGKIVLTFPAHLAEPRPATAHSARAALITGGTGTLGGLVARHLAVTGRAERLVLTSRSGPAAADVAALAAGLAEAGASVDVVACDAADRGELATVLAGVPAEVPLRTVVHTAGVLDDGTVASLTPERIAGVMRPKADGAWNLHELTRGLDLDHFVLFSSSAAAFGVPGQGNYVAANAFLDALAAERRASGLPGLSLGWGLWADASGLTGQLSDSGRDRLTRSGAVALSADEGLALLDLSLTRDEALLVASRLDLSGLRAQAARSAEVPPLWRTLVTAGTGRRSAAGADGAGADPLQQQLAALPAAERDELLLNLVRAHVAAVLGHASGESIESGRPFTDLGFDSLTAVQLRNRLSSATGLRLPATLVFDYPNPAALAGHLRTRLGEGPEPGTTAATGTAAATTTTGATDDPIAIVGMSCRFPGGMAGPEDLWRMLSDGEDAISEFPTDRGWDLEGLYDPDAAQSGTSYTRAGGFVQDASAFDAGFFEISPREALAMDPQQRLLLELAWEAFERSGIDPATLRSTPTGTFVGGYASGYEMSVLAQGGSESEGHLMTGIATSILSGRLAYTFGLEGPAVTVDTACSSALVALHLAAQSLRSGECSLALAGGVTVMATPGTFVEFSRQRGLAADGRCKAFAATADGTGFSEGAGLLVIERLSDARRNGHPVLAVLRGSATNQDGASNGLTAPNGPSQQRVIRAALANAGLTSADVDVVEAHGTGTRLGDPIEAQALLATYGQDRPDDRPLWLGSVKSNIGHTQAAAGVAGVIKMVLALQHGQLPRTLHVDEPSPHVDWASGEVRLLTEPVPWRADGRLRRAGVSSFGISGTNAHVIVEEAPAPQAGPPSGAEPAPAAAPAPLPVVPWLLSARTPEALRAQAGRLRQFLLERPGTDPVDIGFSLATTRTSFDHRAVVQGADRDALLAGLAVAAAGVQTRDVVTGTATAGRKTVFVFPGPAASYGSRDGDVGLDAAAALLDESPVFADRIADCEQALAPHVDWKLTEVLRAGEDSPALGSPEVRHPVLWAVLVSLAALWRSAGVHPAAVAGQGLGEIAAAQVAGVLTAAEAAAGARGARRAAGRRPPGGGRPPPAGAGRAPRRGAARGPARGAAPPVGGGPPTGASPARWST
ncbi:SDR family NAD(P)-dependent oxidoreductase, partial [Streptomyces sp. NPDC059398]|uniref:SDR family NAD(P)-dependent oxidoreductase n=1 Tax=Streptomyces sp. NPDC059398 TaxID=3346820 RepID=UPI0036B985B9